MDRSVLSRRSLVGLGIGGAAAASGALSAVSVAAAQSGPAAQEAPPAAPRPGALTSAPTSQAGLGPRLTLHAIDNFHGTPGAGMVCDLAIRDGEAYKPVKTVVTAANGRTAEPLLTGEALQAGRYELTLHLEAYFRALGVSLPSPNFLGLVPVRFVIRDVGQRYHLPILFSPWGYSYYRGS